LQVRCRRRNVRDRRNYRRRGRNAHWGAAGGTRQRNPSGATVHRRRSPRPAARGGPGGLGRGPSQPVPEVVLRSPPQGRKAPQGHRHRRRRKTGSHRECVVDEPSETGDCHDLTDTVLDQNRPEQGRFFIGKRQKAELKPVVSLIGRRPNVIGDVARQLHADPRIACAIMGPGLDHRVRGELVGIITAPRPDICTPSRSASRGLRGWCPSSSGWSGASCRSRMTQRHL